MDVRLRGVRYTGFDVDPTYDDSTISSFTSPRTKSSSWSKWVQQMMRNKIILLIAIVMMAVMVTTVIVMKLMQNDRVFRRPADIIIPKRDHDHHGSHHGGRVLNAFNRTYTLPEKCENTRQGKEFITDDTGAICNRNQVVASGCCDALIDRLSCSSCRADVACCSSYEYCVSCCLKNTQTKTIQFPPSQYNKCLATCRTSSRSLKHGNKYKHKHKYCYTEGDHDIAFNKSSAKIMAAERGYSCSLSCQSQRLVCHDTYLPQINNCDYLKRHFPCEKGCENGQGSDQPAYVVPDAPESFPRGLCLVNTDQKLFDCESAHENTRRLCVCIPPEAVDQ